MLKKNSALPPPPLRSYYRRTITSNVGVVLYAHETRYSYYFLRHRVRIIRFHAVVISTTRNSHVRYKYTRII